MKRWMSLILSFCMLFSMLPVWTLPIYATYSGSCGDNLTWSFDSETGTLTISGTGSMQEYEYQRDTPWYSFRDDIISIAVTEGVTTLSSGIFKRCDNLISVTLPEGLVAVGRTAFYWCENLTSVTIPASLNSLGDGAFENCSRLEAIEVEDGNLFYYDVDGVLYEKVTKTLLSCPKGKTDTVIVSDDTIAIADNAFVNGKITSVELPEGLKTIGLSSFSCCHNIVSVELPSTLVSIGDYAFNSCSALEEINIPKSTTSIGYQAFDSCNALQAIEVSDENECFYDADGILCNSETKTLLFCPRTKSGTIVIPADIAIIGSAAFDSCSNIDSVILPEGLLSIEARAFMACSSLNGIIFPSTLKSISGYTFSECTSLTEVTIPGSMKEVPWHSFHGCTTLEKVVLENGVESVGRSAFYNCTALSELVLPDTLIETGLNSFSFCSSLETITLPSQLKTIGKCSFSSCDNLKSITVPKTVTEIVYGAFSECNALTEIEVSEGNTSYSSIDGVLYAADMKTLIASPAGRTEGIDIPDTVTRIVYAAFAGSSSLPSATMPVSIESIGDYAFSDCSSLGSIYYDGTAENWSDIHIGAYNDALLDATLSINDDLVAAGTCGDNLTWSFDSETGELTVSGTGDMEDYDSFSEVPWSEYYADVTTLNLSNEITHIGDCAFENLYLYGMNETLQLPAELQSIGDYAFSHCPGLTSVVIPSSVHEIGRMAFWHCSNLTSITLQEGLVSIGQGAFSSCEKIESITIPASVRSITANPFAYCSGLTTITIAVSNPNYCIVDEVLLSLDKTTLIAYPAGKENAIYSVPSSVTTIGQQAFGGCQNLNEITFPDTLTTIEEAAFNASSLTTLTLPASITVIGSNAFGCSDNLSSVTLPIGMTALGEDMFEGCISLTNVIFPESLTAINKGAFACSGLVNITIPSNVTNVGHGAFFACSSLAAVTIKNGVETIDAYAFANCEALEEVMIENGVSMIDRYAFDCCENLTKISIPLSVSRIGMRAFGECTSLSTVYYGGTETLWETVSVGDGNDCLLNADYMFSSLESLQAGLSTQANELRICGIDTEAEAVMVAFYNQEGQLTRIELFMADEIASGVLLSEVDSQQTIKIMQVGENLSPVANVVAPQL